MIDRTLGIKRLNGAERQTIRLMRGMALPSGRHDLVCHGRAIAAAGYAILPRDAAFVGSDELTVLGWLALLQRPRYDGAPMVDARLREALLAMARALADEGIELPYNSILRCAGTVAIPEGGVSENSRRTGARRQALC